MLLFVTCFARRYNIIKCTSRSSGGGGDPIICLCPKRYFFICFFSRYARDNSKQPSTLSMIFYPPPPLTKSTPPRSNPGPATKMYLSLLWLVHVWHTNLLSCNHATCLCFIFVDVVCCCCKTSNATTTQYIMKWFIAYCIFANSYISQLHIIWKQWHVYIVW